MTGVVPAASPIARAVASVIAPTFRNLTTAEVFPACPATLSASLVRLTAVSVLTGPLIGAGALPPSFGAV